jgi:hypothetical protein
VELLGPNAAQHCLTSQTQRKGRSAAAFEAFCKERRGPDVRVLGSNNRLDIIVKHQQKGSVGIEVKWLGKRGHTKKLTQGLGQAMLALENRDRPLLMIHCGTVTSDDRGSFSVLRTGSAWARRQRSSSCRSGGTILLGGVTAFASVFLAHRSPASRGTTN